MKVALGHRGAVNLALEQGQQHQLSKKLLSFRLRLGCLSLRKRLGLDLADAFARHRELLADFFQRVVGVHADAEAHAQHAFLARRQRRQHAGGGFAQIGLDGGVDRQHHIGVLDEVAQMAESSSSPMGVSRLIGSLAILRTLRTFSSGMARRSASSSGVGSRPISCSIWREVRTSLLMVSIMCTGMRMVRAWSAMERVMAWRIHQVA